MSIIARETIISHLESTEEFPIALSDVWEWLGFSTKGNAQKALERLDLNEGEDFEVVIQKDKNLSGGRPFTETKMTVDGFKMWAMSAQTVKGKEVRRYYLQVEKEWKASRAEIPQLSVDQFQSFKHEFETFIPWATEHPIAATIFLERQGLTPIVLEPTPVLNPHPSAETMAALDGAFLNLNRSGLMMNKLFKFLDRIPTMKTLDEDFVNEMVNSLSESERVRTGLKSELQGALQQFRKLRTEHEKLIKQSTALSAELAAMRRKCDSCNIATPVSSIVCNGSVPKRLKSAI